MREGININLPAPDSVRPAIPPKAPPPALRKLELRDGDVICIPADTLKAHFEELRLALSQLHAGNRLLLVTGELQALDEAAMNAAGWYRK